MNIFFRIIGLLTGLLSLGLAGCYYDNNQELHPELLINDGVCDTTVTIRYSLDVAPIMNGSCGANNSCHNAGSSSGINLATYAGVSTIAQNGVLWSAITWDGNASFMPQGSSAKINDCYQAKIRKWIDAGAPEN
ncbi:MAG: hypothetical protein IT260_01165 [Saprospiraceae bacterium]|nr:hypothetical protein [Saprospiraceae bacterium]